MQKLMVLQYIKIGCTLYSNTFNFNILFILWVKDEIDKMKL